MMRWGWVWVMALFAMACEDEGPCGTDADGDIIPVCIYTDAMGDPEYCPGDQFVSDDGCASCGCGPNGQITCTDDLFCESKATE
ncbi:MAG: hypothetical protein AAGA48_37555 [Myxococcota bacterium]